MFDFIPVVSDRMVLASMSSLNTYLGGDNWLLIRPFRKETWCMILVTTFTLIIYINVFSLTRKCLNIPREISVKVTNIVYVTVSFFFVLIVAYYEGALIMFFSTDTAFTFDTIKDVMALYPSKKLMMREGWDVYYKHYVNSGDKDYIEFWDRVKLIPEETVFTSVDEVFRKFPEGNMVIHELEGAIEYYFSRCGGETKEHFDAYVKGRMEYHNLVVT